MDIRYLLDEALDRFHTIYMAGLSYYLWTEERAREQAKAEVLAWAETQIGPGDDKED